MEEISGELERAGLQKETLFKAYEQVHSQASSVLLFTLQWKDLEERFDDLRGSLERRAAELDEGERSLAEREEGLRTASQRMEEREEEVRSKKMDLRSVEMRLEECRDEHRKTESELCLKREALSECNSLIRDKEKELHCLMQATAECRRDYDLKKEEVELLQQELDLNEKKVGSAQAKLEEVSKSLELEGKKFNTVQASIKDRNLELASKERQLESIRNKITQHAEQLRSKQQEYASIQTSIVACTKALESKKKKCRSIHKAITECSQELELKTRQLDSIQLRSRDCLTDLERKEQHLYMLNVSIEERSRIFEMQNKDCDVQSMELELGRKRLCWIEKSIEEHSREMELRERIPFHSKVMAQNGKRPLTNGPAQLAFDFDGKNLSMILYQHFQEHDRVCRKVQEIMQTSADAAKLVLDAMKGFYPKDSGNRDGSLDIGVIRSCRLFLLDNLIRSSVEIKPQQREAAMKLAVEWKGRLEFLPSPEHPLEILSFLHLLEAYKLASAFDANEVQDLVNSVSQFQIAHELHHVLGSSAVRPVKRRCGY